MDLRPAMSAIAQAANGDIVRDLLQWGPAGAVIIVVVYFLRHMSSADDRQSSVLDRQRLSHAEILRDLTANHATILTAQRQDHIAALSSANARTEALVATTSVQMANMVADVKAATAVQCATMDRLADEISKHNKLHER